MTISQAHTEEKDIREREWAALISALMLPLLNTFRTTPVSGSHTACANPCQTSAAPVETKMDSRNIQGEGTEEKGPPLTSITRSHSRSGW